jgi:hypothetical protein
MYRFIHIVLEIGNSSAAAQKLGMSTSGVVDIPFPRSVRDALLAEGLAEEHRWVSNSGWITFQMRGEADLGHALWLMRLSHLRYALKTSTDPQKLFAQESEELHLNDHFKSLLQPYVPKTAKQVSAETVPALGDRGGSPNPTEL